MIFFAKLLFSRKYLPTIFGSFSENKNLTKVGFKLSIYYGWYQLEIENIYHIIWFILEKLI